MEKIVWKDFFGEENYFLIGKDDDIYHVVPERKDDEGNSFTQILSKKAILELTDRIKSNK